MRSAAATADGLAVAWGVEKPLLRRMREGRVPPQAAQPAVATTAVNATASATTTAAPKTSPV
jgi:hypothetical protein